MGKNYSDEFKEHMETFFEGCQIVSQMYYNTRPCDPVIVKCKFLRKHAIISDDMHGKLAFVNYETGNVHRRGSGNRPSKKAYGNIYDEYNGMEHMGVRGPGTDK